MRAGALCMGYGGLELALDQVLDIDLAWYSEYDRHASTILTQHWPAVPNLGDLTVIDWSTVPPVDVLSAGYPCQPFSHAGKRKGSADARHLWPYIVDAVRHLRPGLVVLENVAGHLSLGFGRVLGDLAEVGYDARWTCLRAADVGAPHGRLRVFITATDAGRQRHGGGENPGSVGRVDSQDAGAPWERERSRPESGDRGSTPPADTGCGSLAGPAAAGFGLSVVAERGPVATADAGCSGRGEEGPRGCCVVGESGVQAGRDEGAGTHRPDRPAATAWGTYGPAIRRWEAILGRPAPAPTEPGRNGPRLSPHFVEWMMGLPAGWVTTSGIPRNAQLKALGNGVVPQQAATALTWLLNDSEAAA